MKDSFKQYLLKSLEAANAAGEAILEVYNKPVYEKELKADHTPVTEADRAAHTIIMEHLQPLGFPVLSEEGKEIGFNERKQWTTFWLVDPLDGTKEFIRKNGEFTVNIALIDQNRPVLGILYAPLHDLMYFSDVETGAFRMTNFTNIWKDVKSVEDLLIRSEKLPVEGSERPYRVVASRSHSNEQTESYVKTLRKTHPDLELVSRGSALKICTVAEGSADIYPRFGPTWEWDTGAGQAIAEASGCRVTLHDSDEALTYNKEILLNPFFIVKRGS